MARARPVGKLRHRGASAQPRGPRAREDGGHVLERDPESFTQKEPKGTEGPEAAEPRSAISGKQPHLDMCGWGLREVRREGENSRF